MVVYNFKSIAPVPSAGEFVDIILSKTQRKTPTVVHRGYNISRIRRFYMRKIKFTQENYHERISLILDQFPRLDDIHPFYSDLINVLYSRDHYKLALGQINTAKSLIDNIGKDYLKLIKFGDSLYRCKELKRAALGRMCTVVKKLSTSLQYLEQVRQHLSRLPSIDTSTRTLLITGCPNTGKSSFLNAVSNAKVEVQPYAFTTKSLFVGHFDYLYVKWQIIDTPGLLDQELEQRGTIEMQSITALAHIHSTVLYFMDLSEQCGYSLQQQISLFHSIKPLFANKALLIIANKTDLKKLSDLSTEDRAAIEAMIKDRPDSRIMEMSNIAGDNIIEVRNEGCKMIREKAVQAKLKSKKINEIANKIQITQPIKRDNKARSLSIPTSVLADRAAAAELKEQAMADNDGLSSLLSKISKRKTEREIELENGGAGVYNIDLKKNYSLSNTEWRYDVIPEILDGHNIADFYDEDIERKLAALEEEELAAIEAEGLKEGEDVGEGSELDEDTQATVHRIRQAKKIHIADAQLRKTNNKPVIPRRAANKSISALEESLNEQGLVSEKAVQRARSKTPRNRGSLNKKRGRSEEQHGDDEAMHGTNLNTTASAPTELESKLRARSKSRTGRADSIPRASAPSPFRNVKQKLEAERLSKVVQKKFNQQARQGESDRHFYDEKPKHLFSGKRGMGKTDRR
jgi:nucleolar GTP-binding protein